MFKRTLAAAGNPTNYAGFAFLLFVWYFLYNIFLYGATSPLPSTLQTIIGWANGLLLTPLVMAGLYGGIYEHQRTKGETGVSEFPANALRYFGRFALINLIYTAFVLAIMIAIAGILHTDQMDAIHGYLEIPGSAIMLFWFASVVLEGGLFEGLGRALKILLQNPLALALGIMWGLLRYADNKFLTVLGSTPNSLAINGADAAMIAAIRVLVSVYAIALYIQIRREALDAQPSAATPPYFQQSAAIPQDAIQTATNDSLIKASFGFAFVGFLPLLNLVPLILGILAIKRNKHFSMRAAIAIGVGGFFTAFYVLMLAGWAIADIVPSGGVPGYQFLKESNPTLASPVALMEDGYFDQAQGQLEPIHTSSSNPGWSEHCALAIAKWGNNKLDDALDDFYAASQQKPDRSEFYYYYGRALLANDQPTLAAEQFKKAALYAPRLDRAAHFASLTDAIYTPSQTVSAAFTILILLFLFTVHEYGHAYAAWKLGDDTAKNMGRLTLNPIRHLDLFGSILLPGILLLHGSEVIFGWAKPVLVNPQNFKDPRKDHMRVSFAGPAVNLLVAMVCFLFLAFVALALRMLWPETLTWRFAAPYGSLAIVGPPFSPVLTIIVIFIRQLMYTSLVLGFLNLLPIPPLDGSWILAGILPEPARNVFDQIRNFRFGYVLFLLLMVTPILDYYVQLPIGLTWSGLNQLLSAVGLR